MCGVREGGGGVFQQCQVEWSVPILVTGGDVCTVVHQQFHHTTVTLEDEKGRSLRGESGVSLTTVLHNFEGEINGAKRCGCI